MAEIKRGNPYDELNKKIFFGILAYSHMWKGANALYETITKNLFSSDYESPNEMIDVVCIANSVTYHLVKDLCVGDKAEVTLKEMITSEFQKKGVGLTRYSKYKLGY